MRTIVKLTFLAALACPIYAVDGVVLINQNAALAGNVTPGDAPGFPVTISQPGSYRLSSNLTVPDANTTAIVIANSDITLDLNGFSIIGPTRCDNTPGAVTCSPKGTGLGITTNSDVIQRFTVMNGSVRGMGASGILLAGREHRVDRVNASSNGGIGISAGTVTSCTADSNGGDGIEGELVTGSVSNSNGNDGIAGGMVTGNVTTFNVRAGIFGQGVVSHNLSQRNGTFGINAVCPSSVGGNTATSNPGGNIFTTGSGCVLTNNAAP